MGEFIDHPSYVIDLSDNGVRALFKNGAVFGDHFPVLAAQAFG
jgi:hypothetical protein